MTASWSAALLASALAWGAEPVPPAYAPVLAAHSVTAEDLRRVGFDFVDGACVPVDESGAPAGPALSPAQLDAALKQAKPALEPAKPPAKAPAVPALPDKVTEGDLKRLFDNGRGGPAPLPAAGLDGREPSRAPGFTFIEPPFDGSWDAARAKLSGRRSAEGVRSVAARFTFDEESPTGLSADAPEALRVLSEAILERRGGEAAVRELDRQLKTVAYLKLEQKEAFAKELRSPLPVYAALAVSHMPHYSDAGLYFARMKELLAEQSVPLPKYIADTDPTERHAQKFLLRLHVYDLFMPHLSRVKADAPGLTRLLFPEERSLRPRALQIQGVVSQVSAYAGMKSAMAFAEVVAELAQAREDVSLLLALNAASLPAAARGGAAPAPLPEGLLEDPRLAPPSPDAAWPEGDVRIRMHFPNPVNYRMWFDFFTRNGYRVEETTVEGVTVAKAGPERTVRLTAVLYKGDEEGYLLADEKKRFLAAVAADLKDPAVQGIVVRTHAQFHYPAMFRGKVSPGKLWLDGSCRGAWYQEELQRLCTTCKPITNTGTGMSEITNPVLYEVLEGVAAGDEWDGIHARLKARLPRAHTRLMGPWTPRFDRALDLLKQSKKSAAPAPTASR